MAKKNQITPIEAVTKYEAGKLLSKADCKVLQDAIFTAASNYISRHGVAGLLPAVYNEQTAAGVAIGRLYLSLIFNARRVVQKAGRPFSDAEAKAYFGLSITNDHNAKMAGMAGVSSNNKVNELCACHKACPGSICEDCFASRQIDFMGSMNKPLTLNYLLLNYALLPTSIMPIVNRQFFRIESFGDVGSITQAANYIRLATAHDINKRCRFGAWSKNPVLWEQAFATYGKPENMSFGISSLFKNQIAPASAAPHADFIFTVWTDEAAAAAAGVAINCGARHCITCLLCYMAADHEGITYVHELLK